MKRLIFFLLLLFLYTQEALATVAASDCRHNLSYNSDRVKAVSSAETQVCKFCHIPHGKHATLTSHTTGYGWYDTIYPSEGWANKSFRLPLFSHEVTTNVNSARISFSSGPPRPDLYESGEAYNIRISTWAYGPTTSFVHEAGIDEQLNTDDDTWEIDWPASGSSRMCFSCHDGTVRIGGVYNSSGTISYIEMTDSGLNMLSDGKLSGTSGVRFLPPATDWSSDFASKHSCEHAFYSFRMHENVIQDSSSGKPPGTPSLALQSMTYMRGSGVLDRYDFVQCTACHDPHKGGDGTPNGGPPNYVEGAYTGGSRQFWREPGVVADEVCKDCHAY